MPDLQKVADAVSAITLPEINYTVKIENIPISDHATRISLMSAQNDQLDIINTGRTVSLSEMVAMEPCCLSMTFSPAMALRFWKKQAT